MNLAASVDDHPAGDVALVSGDTSMTYGELRDRAARVRAALLASGLAPGDRVAIVSGNDPAFVVAFLAVVGAGLVAVPLNPQSPEPEIASQVAASRVGRVLVGPAGEGLGLDGAVRVSDLESRGDADGGTVRDVAADTAAVLAFSSGTGGAPRAAVLSHGNLLANQRQVASRPELARRADDVTLGVLPLFHVFGLNVVLLPALAAGSRVVLVDHLDPAEIVDLVHRHRVTLLTGPPPLWAALADVPRTGTATTDRLATIRVAASGAAALPVEVAAAVRDRWGLEVREGYGLTETSPVVAIAAGTDAPAGSIGRPLDGVEVRLIDEEGQNVLVGDVGEIQVRGENVTSGYWDDAEATAAAFTPDGWFRTGDLAVVDDDGHLFVVDRLKDIIIVSGFNVAPAEVEQAVAAHRAVLDVAVVGEPDPRTGEAVVAYVVLRPDAPRLGPEELTAEVRDTVGERLARYKCPAEVRVVERIPRGLGGKLLRRELDGGDG